MITATDSVHVAQAISWYAAGMGFVDALHLCGSVELEGIAAFSRKFAALVEKLDAFSLRNLDEFEKSRIFLFVVIPAKAGIQLLRCVPDSRLRGSDSLLTFYETVNLR